MKRILPILLAVLAMGCSDLGLDDSDLSLSSGGDAVIFRSLTAVPSPEMAPGGSIIVTAILENPSETKTVYGVNAEVYDSCNFKVSEKESAHDMTLFPEMKKMVKWEITAPDDEETCDIKFRVYYQYDSNTLTEVLVIPLEDFMQGTTGGVSATTTYGDSPLKLLFFVPDQPLAEGQSASFYFRVENAGSGDSAEDVDVKILLPSGFSPDSESCEDFKDGSNGLVPVDDIALIKGKSETLSCVISVPDNIKTKRKYSFEARASYDYEIRKEMTVSSRSVR